MAGGARARTGEPVSLVIGAGSAAVPPHGVPGEGFNAPASTVGHVDPDIEAGIARYAAWWAGNGSVLVRPRLAFPGLERAVETVAQQASGPLLVTDLASPGHVVSVGSTAARLAGDAHAQSITAFHTSGSTGSPTCVIYRSLHISHHALSVAAALELDARLRYLALPPPQFAYGLSIVHSHVSAGVPVTFASPTMELPPDVSALPARSLAVYALPQHTPFLLASPIPDVALARLFIAGGRISRASVTALARRFPQMRLTNMYGQAEMGPRLALWEGAPRDFKEGEIGLPLPGVELGIDDDGTLLARSTHAMSWSLRPPYTDLRAFDGRTSLIRTGDLATRLPDGTFRHDGRGDHFLNVAGTKIEIRSILSVVQGVVNPLLVQIFSRPARTGDARPVIEMVTSGPGHRDKVHLRRALHTEFGSVAALFDLRYVERPTVSESGK